MPAIAVATDPWTERRRRTFELRSRYSFARQVLDFYGALLGVQEAAFYEARRESPPASSLVAYVSERVAPRVIDVGIAAGPDRLRSELIRVLERADTRHVIAGWIQGEEQGAPERFLARAAVGPVLEALGTEARRVVHGPRDARHCPECGGPPQLSYSAPATEDLATGPRRLLCARCGTNWGYARMTCAACGESSSSKLTIFSEEGTTSGERGSVVRGLQGALTPGRGPALFPHVRIEACETCRRYLVGIDVAADPAAVPEVDELTAIPLDLYARERGFVKITPNLVGF